MKILKTGTVFLMLILMAIGFSSCSSDGGGDPTYALEGSWTITTVPTSGDSIGTANVNLVFLINFIADFYMGSYTLTGGALDDTYINGGATDFAGSVDFNFNDGVLDIDDNPVNNIDYVGTLSGSIVSGTYSGTGIYAAYSGTFTAAK